MSSQRPLFDDLSAAHSSITGRLQTQTQSQSTAQSQSSDSETVHAPLRRFHPDTSLEIAATGSSGQNRPRIVLQGPASSVPDFPLPTCPDTLAARIRFTEQSASFQSTGSVGGTSIATSFDTQTLLNLADDSTKGADEEEELQPSSSNPVQANSQSATNRYSDEPVEDTLSRQRDVKEFQQLRAHPQACRKNDFNEAQINYEGEEHTERRAHDAHKTPRTVLVERDNIKTAQGSSHNPNSLPGHVQNINQSDSAADGVSGTSVGIFHNNTEWLGTGSIAWHEGASFFGTGSILSQEDNVLNAEEGQPYRDNTGELNLETAEDLIQQEAFGEFKSERRQDKTQQLSCRDSGKRPYFVSQGLIGILGTPGSTPGSVMSARNDIAHPSRDLTGSSLADNSSYGALSVDTERGNESNNLAHHLAYQPLGGSAGSLVTGEDGEAILMPSHDFRSAGGAIPRRSMNNNNTSQTRLSSMNPYRHPASLIPSHNNPFTSARPVTMDPLESGPEGEVSGSDSESEMIKKKERQRTLEILESRSPPTLLQQMTNPDSPPSQSPRTPLHGRNNVAHLQSGSPVSPGNRNRGDKVLQSRSPRTPLHRRAKAVVESPEDIAKILSASRSATVGHESSPKSTANASSAWTSTIGDVEYEHEELPAMPALRSGPSVNGSFAQASRIGPKLNITGTPEGTGMREVGSSLADDSSPEVNSTNTPVKSHTHQKHPQTPHPFFRQQQIGSPSRRHQRDQSTTPPSLSSPLTGTNTLRDSNVVSERSRTYAPPPVSESRGPPQAPNASQRSLHPPRTPTVIRGRAELDRMEESWRSEVARTAAFIRRREIEKLRIETELLAEEGLPADALGSREASQVISQPPRVVTVHRSTGASRPPLMDTEAVGPQPPSSSDDIPPALRTIWQPAHIVEHHWGDEEASIGPQPQAGETITPAGLRGRPESFHLLPAPETDDNRRTQLARRQRWFSRVFFGLCLLAPPALVFFGLGYMDGLLAILTRGEIREFRGQEKRAARWAGGLLFCTLVITIVVVMVTLSSRG